ncbi:hypothetical protein CTEN210_11768 [Chaetoceros tenuissimus]|uniref:tRNA(Ile)-lysidine/2-thiocytidine synthase N-terminal domain-containing protein n=1 Tax=Chaetoceros tenuissimus TaxID=426638 RepID=A0AAD3H977_9STRA|nr:hypothetical protein CTEN210_11768 [Chaetoceros tenuissimus]
MKSIILLYLALIFIIQAEAFVSVPKTRFSSLASSSLFMTTDPQNDSLSLKQLNKLEGKLKKQLRNTSKKYKMIQDNDHIMCCVSGGKDSATMLYLLCALQKQLRQANVHFKITAVHLNQMQPGYDGQPLLEWLDDLVQQEFLEDYKIITEDTYSIVIDKTPENKVYCSMCSRLRRGILYTVAHDIGANKIALGHHGDDAIQTLLLNFIHAGQMKSMPARYYSNERDIHVIRPLMGSLEEDIAQFAQAMEFPILPCNLCGTQPDAQRAKVRMLIDTLEALNPNAKKNMMNAMADVRPSHLLDVGLREVCGMDGATGEIIDGERATKVKAISSNEPNANGDGDENDVNGDKENQPEFISLSKIESLL